MNRKDFIGIIPARFASTRLPGKPLEKIGGKTIIEHVYRRVVKVLPVALVATDDVRIFDEVKSFGGNVVMTSPYHASGTDRILEAYDAFEAEAKVVLNIQGDEPFISHLTIERLMELFMKQAKEVEIGTALINYRSDTPYSELKNPNHVKVVRATSGRALYFSRNVIPFLREVDTEAYATKHVFYKHVGIYGYKIDVLRAITKLPQSSLEKAERLEQLRWLEAGYTINTVLVEDETIGIDTLEDLEKARAYWVSNLEKHD